jgi:aldehyde dehydrogenase (NAD+)
MLNPDKIPISPNTPTDILNAVFLKQKEYQFIVRRTNAKERILKLKRLYQTILENEAKIEEAIFLDFKKSKTETAISELGVVLGELRHTIKHLRTWMQTQSVSTPLTLFGSSSEIMYEPKGVCLIISPWNYPFNLTFAPLISAVAAGNCCIIKPSEFTKHSSALIKKMVEHTFSQEEVFVAEGDVSVAQTLLDLPFNHIFFTGSPAVGKVVMAAAAKHLTSVTLELGGKSPVIVDASANLDQAAAKIAWLKAMNAGQICIAPDYVLAHTSIKDELVAKITQKFEQYYGTTSEQRMASPDFCRIVNARHFIRIKSLLDDAVEKGAHLSFGGNVAELDNYIEPTVLTNVPENAAIWKEEIFGPLLPIRTWTNLDEAIQYVNAAPQPLALYIFSTKNSITNTILRETRNGGVTVNDCGPHFYNAELPFGGVNNSGIGKCHGHFGFLDFSNQRGVLRQTRFMPSTDLMLPPYGGRLAKILLKGIVRWF